MDRRAFVVALLAAWGCGRQEEPKKVAASRIPRVTLFYFGSAGPASSADVFRQRLSELGYVEGKSIFVEERFAGGDAQRLAEIARELAQNKVDVIVTSAVAATAAARQATSTIPIVMVHAGNPVGAGLIADLVRPGGNVTGTMNLPLGGKHVDLIRELTPRITKLAVLVNPTNSGAITLLSTAKDAASKYGITVSVVEATRAEDFPSAFAAIRAAQPDWLLVGIEPMIGSHSTEVIEFAAGARLPAIYDFGEMPKRGGLIAYATRYPEHYALAADYVDKILRGANPADMPVQQPARFELVINMKTAKALGLSVPLEMLKRADEVIQ